mmetsp:Transcript_8449/g.25614  ORF Transcript_8449/g.25614 Transcript_8449/m.25614 type:complete len:209 (-) Transcript_8449:115-741(-)
MRAVRRSGRRRRLPRRLVEQDLRGAFRRWRRRGRQRPALRLGQLCRAAATREAKEGQQMFLTIEVLSVVAGVCGGLRVPARRLVLRETKERREQFGCAQPLLHRGSLRFWGGRQGGGCTVRHVNAGLGARAPIMGDLLSGLCLSCCLLSGLCLPFCILYLHCCDAKACSFASRLRLRNATSEIGTHVPFLVNDLRFLRLLCNLLDRLC